MLLTMFIKCFVTSVVLLHYVSARLDIIVNANLKKVDAFGSDVAIISDTERSSFGIEEHGLKGAVEKAFGQWPTDVFVRSPTPWADLYKTYSWKQVERTLRPTSSEIVSSSTESITLDTKNFENNSSSPINSRGVIHKQELYVVSHKWTKSADINSGIKLTYRMNFPVDMSEGSMSMSYKNNWGNDKIASQPVTIGSISGVKFKLPSGAKATATLVAEKVNIEVRVNYEVTLQGQAALNYALTYKGHHFWGYAINDLLSQSNKPQTLTSTENIKISYYTKAKVIVKDNNNNKVIAEINTPIDVVQDFANVQNYNEVDITLPIVYG